MKDLKNIVGPSIGLLTILGLADGLRLFFKASTIF